MEYLDVELQGLDSFGIAKSFKLRDFLGKTVLLYFYPKDNTSGCTLQAQELRDYAQQFEGKATVVGVSPDGIKSHEKFFNAHNLNFVLLSDVDKILAQQFGVWVEKTMYGKKYMGILRSTFLLDQTGKVAQEFRNVKVDGHAQKILDYLNVEES